MVIVIPNEILEASKASGVGEPCVAAWLRAHLAEANISVEVSPADWPAAIWQAYRTLREEHEPATCGGSALRLFDSLDFSDGN